MPIGAMGTGSDPYGCRGEIEPAGPDGPIMDAIREKEGGTHLKTLKR